MTASLATLPGRIRAANMAQTLVCLALLTVVVCGLVLLFGRTGERIAVLLSVNVAAVVALGVFCGNTGIVSFGHGSFMLLGAYTSGILTMKASLQRTALPQLPDFLAGHELSLIAAIPCVALAGLALAAASGTAIARLAGASATIATLGLLIILHSLAVGAREITRGSQTFYGITRITDVLLIFLIACSFIVIARLYRESRWGLMARAVRDDAAAAEALSINPRRTRFIAWCLSGTMAALAGALYGHMLGAFSPASFYLSLVFAQVAMLIVGGMATISGAVTGVVAITLLQDGVRRLEGGITIFGQEMPAVFGLTTVAVGISILLIIWLRPAGLVGGQELGPTADARIFRGLTGATASAPTPDARTPTTLRAEGLSRSFAGVQAVSDAALSAPTGTVTGLIGPNGAGKSTLVNLLTRAYDADRGSARFGDADLLATKPDGIARLGVARTFQNLRLFDDLTVYQNVLVSALAAGHRGRGAAAIALRELAAFELGEVASQRAGSLPYGARKRLEIARAMAQDPGIILLDEPAAGMNPAETEDLANRLTRVVDERGTGMLLIDHDLRFVNRLSTRIVVMNRGAVIAEGTPAAIRADPGVIEAYVGRGRTAKQNQTDSQTDNQTPNQPSAAEEIAS
ncbi:MAG: branched-chain amino acid ABC transporter ATP-binding protein/permease [Pseudomonadota bacterium]